MLLLLLLHHMSLNVIVFWKSTAFLLLLLKENTEPSLQKKLFNSCDVKKTSHDLNDSWKKTVYIVPDSGRAGARLSNRLDAQGRTRPRLFWFLPPQRLRFRIVCAVAVENCPENQILSYRPQSWKSCTWNGTIWHAVAENGLPVVQPCFGQKSPSWYNG